MQTVNIALFVYSFILLISIYLSSGQVRYKLMSDRLFRSLIRVTLLLLMVDMIARFEGLDYWFYPVFSRVGNFVSYGISHFISSLWFLYIHNRIYTDTERTKNLYKYFFLINLVKWILLIITQFTGWYYYLDSSNIYHRGPLFFWTQLVNAVILLSSLVLLVLKRKRIEQNTMFAYILFSLIPAIGLTLQIILPGIAYIPNSVAAALIILYLFVQNNKVRYDHLTGIFNRRHMDYYLEDKLISAKRGKPFSAILFDLDDFKDINDTLGHSVGDIAIKKTAKILASASSKHEFLARYGGDEFLIITSKYEKQDIDEIVKRVYDGINQFNKINDKFKLSISHGYYVYHKDLNLSRDQFIDVVDRNMYDNKIKKKNSRV
ncbi:GGDEF domain-containing protein [Acholeplasma laidlawii]|uniref:GGDEF domain-containing protein n=1 Tax=Acholeplasma laidlawii TaxID=2148 RepID=A0A553IJH6_ACHLA|nr:GGDEF domain-containing protein [Acholeplasma laidlawii]NWH12024.1 GGDEF domain-containing protein [Acholeplasma laidlawii]NWH12567.1 GGDEF domain-containing protein [Acholeplasma laidlawii]NWH14799.1 GGDEF domain-containing protein [Acholeplasma laidlawii]TRY00370.1 GGDEF domain-containing protein [Acholeplasma laidlawii]